MRLDDVDPRLLLQLETELTDHSLEEFLEFICRRYRLNGIVYFSPSFRGHSLTDPFIVRTRDAEWADAYATAGRAVYDPIIQTGACTLLPMDWARLRRNSGNGFIGVGGGKQARGDCQGLTIPVRGPTNSVWALFLATSTEPAAAWAAAWRERIRDLVHVAHYVHQRVCAMHDETPPADLKAITKREIEALEWAAEGKNQEEIAREMRISQETVKAHFDSARYKLQALNRVHAVARAIRAGLIH